MSYQAPVRIKIDIRQGAGGQWRWVAYNQDDQYLSHSAGYDSMEDAIDASNLVVQGCPNAAWYDLDGNNLHL